MSDVWYYEYPVRIISRLKISAKGANVDNKEEFLNSIESLDLGGLRLAEIPDIVTLLPNLKKLDLSRNGIKTVGESIGVLEKLEVLDLSFNKLKTLELPPSKRLTNLVVSNNQLDEIPKNLKEFDKLRVLYLDDNNIESITEDLKLPKKLIDLNLSNNKIKEIKISKGGLGGCTVITLANNRIEEFPLEFLDERLGVIDVSKNNLKDYSFLDDSRVRTKLIKV